MSLPRLRAEEFSAFFTALHGVDKNGVPIEPFRWQTRLAGYVNSKGRWPPVLDIPTGAGKTSVLEIALFHVALEADRGSRRRAPARIALIVDRRVVVNAAYERARLIAERLQQALACKDTRSVFYRVARRLIHLSDGGAPVIARALHGGAPREDDWARTPCQPTILCSTVDQVGSRLLFRGYGVSDAMKPVHAGLLGADCLILLDEAHLSEPFSQTLQSIERYRQSPWTASESAPWGYVSLSATPVTQKEPGTFSLSRGERSDRRLAPRLSVRKPAELILAKARTREPAAHAEELAAHAWNLSGLSTGTSPRIIALVVNRVNLARRCHEVLLSRIRKSAVSAEAVLFIGRTREVDRTRLLAAYEPRLKSGRSDPDITLFVIATQCIEAGADFDFDAIVAQAAPIDVLRQRFGRVNRLGERTSIESVIMACRDEIDGRLEDPVYGTRTAATWEWLVSRSADHRMDFGCNTIEESLKDVDISLLTTEKRSAPTLMPGYVDLWAQTGPVPPSDPEPALFLHGAPDTAEIQIVWRADIRPQDLLHERAEEHALPIIELMPPKAAESMAVPIHAARAWLSGKTPAPLIDVEGMPEVESSTRTGRMIPAFRWQGSDSERTGAVAPWDLYPGDLIIVSSVEGGCDQHGWKPESDRRVTDVGEIACWPYRKRRFAFRVHRFLFEDAFDSEGEVRPSSGDLESAWRRVYFNIQEARNDRSGVNVAKRLLTERRLPKSWRTALGVLAKARNVRIAFPYDDIESPQVSGLVLIAPFGVDRERKKTSMEFPEASTESEDQSCFQENSITLEAHSRHVAEKVRLYARQAGLPPRLTKDLVLAALLHDEGKRDARFQLYLRRGDRLAAALDRRVLAKSAKGAMDRRTRARLCERLGLPRAWRHEADSVRRALGNVQLKSAHNPQLVLWLIGTHHGYGRPMFPHTDPANQGPQDLDFTILGDDWPELFCKLLRRYGAWELARLESILRLADHRASEEEQLAQVKNSPTSTRAEVA